MANPIAVNVGTQPSQLWAGRNAQVNTLLLMNTDQQNTVMVGTSLTSLVVPIQPNGSLSVDPTENWYVVGTVAGNAPLVVVPNGQGNFLGLSQGYGNIAVPQFKSPNYDPVSGTGWALFQDGTASFNEITLVIQSNGIALLIYFPSPGLGNLIGSWAASEFTDQYGNDVPAGLNANGGQLAAIALNAPSVVGGTIFQTLLNAVTITNSNLSGGTSFEQTITFDSNGGLLFGYTNTTTTVTQTANGTYQQTLPAGVTTIVNPQVWAAGAGGNGGSTSQGGSAGAGGEFAGATSYTPSTNPFSYTVGNGGNNSTTGSGNGGDGGDSFIDGNGIYANGGSGNGSPGTGSSAPIHHDGGAGGNASGFAGGASGGNSGNPTSAGNSGLASIGTSHAGAPVAQTGSGQGGTGGDSGGNAANGSSPGAGGGGAGKGAGTPATLTKTYEALYTASYYGPDATITGNRNKLRSTSVLYQGGETASGGAANGNQRSVMVFDSNQIAADFAGYTPTQLTLKVVNLHSWYNSGMTLEFDVGNAPTKYPTGGAPSTWLGQQNFISEGSIGEGSTHSYNLGSAIAGYFINNQTNFLGFGAFVAANHPYNLNYYGYQDGGHNVNVEITITGTQTVAGSTTSGQGSDGKISFQFVNSSILAFALAPSAGVDSGGNNYGAGYTGPVNVFDPNTPSAVEGWHSATIINGWAKQGFARYKLVGYNMMLIQVQLNDVSATSGTFMNMPTGYSASQSQFPEITEYTNAAGTASNAWIIQVGTGPGGSLNILQWAKKSHQFVGNFLISLD
jgi:hypothetical protein